MFASLSNGTTKKDLHVGGLGVAPSGSLAAVIDPLVDASENWMHKARDFVSSADEYVRANPWQAIGVMAMVGVTVGFLISRRGSRRHGSETWVEE